MMDIRKSLLNYGKKNITIEELASLLRMDYSNTSDGHQKTYISKKDFTLARQLARKKYLTLKLDEIKKEKRALGFYLNHHASVDKADALLTESLEYQKLLSGQFALISNELEEWKNLPYEKNNIHPERLIYKSISGNLVRSKSEMMIDMLLFQHQIPIAMNVP